MKKVLSMILAAGCIIMVSACGEGEDGGSGESYTCKRCEETTSKAYYDMNSSKDSVMCEDCARKYWMPLDYKTYRVR